MRPPARFFFCWAGAGAGAGEEKGEEEEAVGAPAPAEAEEVFEAAILAASWREDGSRDVRVSYVTKTA